MKIVNVKLYNFSWTMVVTWTKNKNINPAKDLHLYLHDEGICTVFFGGGVWFSSKGDFQEEATGGLRTLNRFHHRKMCVSTCVFLIRIRYVFVGILAHRT